MTIEARVLESLDRQRAASVKTSPHDRAMRFFYDGRIADDLGLHLTQVKDALVRLQRKGLVVRFSGMAARREWI